MPKSPIEGGVHVNVTQTQGVPTQTVYQGGKVVNKVVYVVLAICLGGIGVHKFSSGKIGLGIVYLLFCWSAIPAIIALIEGIMAAFKPADANGNIVV